MSTEILHAQSQKDRGSITLGIGWVQATQIQEQDNPCHWKEEEIGPDLRILLVLDHEDRDDHRGEPAVERKHQTIPDAGEDEEPAAGL